MFASKLMGMLEIVVEQNNSIVKTILLLGQGLKNNEPYVFSFYQSSCMYIFTSGSICRKQLEGFFRGELICLLSFRMICDLFLEFQCHSE